MALVFEDEIITQALVRYITPPGLDGEMALITIDNGHDHTRPTTLGPAGLANLDRALDQVMSRGNVRALAVTGKPYIFGAGADLSAMRILKDREQAVEILALGHRVFAKLRDLPLPTFAFINGLALGGALELALHADYRTVSASARGIGLPEVFLGLAPGWGGSWLLPHLIGPEGALKVIVENPLAQNRMLRPTEAAELGVADALFESADFLERSIAWAVDVVNGHMKVERRQFSQGEEWAQAVAAARMLVSEKQHGASLAPLVALDLIDGARKNSYAEGMAAEDDRVAELILSPELRRSLYAFDLTRHRAKKPAGAPSKSLARPVTKVGVVGAGLMASQLALLFSRRLGVPVVMTDVDSSRLEKGLGYVDAEVDRQLSKGRISSREASRIRAGVTGSLDKAAFADADLVVEAVFEEMGVKKQVFAEIEAVVRHDAILATNTSSLSVTEMASDLAHPERVVGIHFFNPVAIMPLVEIIRAKATDDATLATAFAVGKELRKTCVLVGDAPAFVVNRLLVRSLDVVLRAIDQGANPVAANTSLDNLGLPMRPAELVELVGPAVALHVARVLTEAFPDRFGVPAILEAAVEQGKPALFIRKRGEYVLDPDLTDVVESSSNAPSSEEVRSATLSALSTEISLMIEEGVVASTEDIDVCMLLGAGWPFYLGGITPYLKAEGYLPASS